jgi:hypothetical protein
MRDSSEAIGITEVGASPGRDVDEAATMWEQNIGGVQTVLIQ